VTWIYTYCGEPTSGLEPLSCSLRVIHQALQWYARACKSRISRRLYLLRDAECCIVLRSRWYQSGINITLTSASFCGSSLVLVSPHRAGCRRELSRKFGLPIREHFLLPGTIVSTRAYSGQAPPNARSKSLANPL
jgi:hypothetical protein